MSIAARIWACVGLVIVGYLGATGVGLLLAVDHDRKIDRAAHTQIPMARLSQDALVAFGASNEAFADAVILGDVAQLDRGHTEARGALAALREIRGLPLGAGDLTAVVDVSDRLEGWLEQARATYVRMAEGELEDSLVRTAGELNEKSERLSADLGQLVELSRRSVTSTLDTVIEDGRQARTINAVACVLVILFATGGVFLVVRGTTKPLAEMTGIADAIARGSVGQDIRYRSRNEIGTLAESLRGLTRYTREMAAAGEALSRGDLSARVEPRSPNDLLANSMNCVADVLKRLDHEARELTEAARNGHLQKRGEVSRFEGVYGDLVQGINATLDAMVKPTGEAIEVLEKTASRELTVRMLGDYSNDHARLKNSVNRAVANLDEAMEQVANASEQVSSAAQEISGTSQRLAMSASHQVASLDDIRTTMESIAEQSQINATHSASARTCADEARQSAVRGSESMRELSGAIEKIKESSDQTAAIVRTIDDIAFQTNLLALNAAVEAARAGEAGKGFAVVAEEVRRLAGRSAEAARATSEMIRMAIQSSETGVSLNRIVLTHLAEITDKVNEVGEVMGAILASSVRQKDGVGDANVAIARLADATQENAAYSEESASASLQLTAQSQSMLEMVGTFSLTRQALRLPEPPVPGEAAQPATPDPTRRALFRDMDAAPAGALDAEDLKALSEF